MKPFSLKLLILFLYLSTWIEGKESKTQENLKVLILITASDNLPVYAELTKIWRSYMHSDPEHIEAYFIKDNPYQFDNYMIHDDVIWTKTNESIIPGILNKTILAMECMFHRLDEFDYVIKTNLSSFYVFSRLLKFLNTLPRTQCYCGAKIDFLDYPFVSGAGTIFSTDLAKRMVFSKDFFYDSTWFDDTRIGYFFQLNNIEIISASRLDLTLEKWFEISEKVPLNIFHFRTTQSPELRMTDELYLQNDLKKMFYP